MLLTLILLTCLEQGKGDSDKANSATPRKLEWKFKEGQQFWVDTTTQLRRTRQTVNESAVENSTIVTKSKFLVKKLEDDGTVDLEQKIESSKYSCSNPEAEKFASLFRRLEGATFLITFSPDMQVQNFKGYKEWCARLAALDANETERFKAMVPESELKVSVTEGFGFLPKEKVKPGDKWDRDYLMNISPVGILSGKLQYTYKSALDQGKVQITLKHSGASKYKMQSPDDALSDFTMENRSGTIVFNAEQGRIDSAEYKITTKGTYKLPAEDRQVTVDVMNEMVSKMTVRDKPLTPEKDKGKGK